MSVFLARAAHFVTLSYVKWSMMDSTPYLPAFCRIAKRDFRSADLASSGGTLRKGTVVRRGSEAHKALLSEALTRQVGAGSFTSENALLQLLGR